MARSDLGSCIRHDAEADALRPDTYNCQAAARPKTCVAEGCII